MVGGPVGTERSVAICSPAELPKTPSRFQSTQAFKMQAVGPPAVTVKEAVDPGTKGPVKVTPSSSWPGVAQVPMVRPEPVLSSPVAWGFWLKPPSASTQAPSQGAFGTPRRWKAPLSRTVGL